MPECNQCHGSGIIMETNIPCPNHRPQPEFTVRHLAAIRRAILDLLDEGNAGQAGRVWLTWDFDNINEDFANAQRLDFCDALDAYLLKRSK